MTPLATEQLEPRSLLAISAQLIDINQSPPAVSVAAPSFASVGNRFFFERITPEHGAELWTSDGTSQGTVLVKGFRPDATQYYTLQGLTNVSGQLFFTANDGMHGYELWKSDGTTAGTVMVKDIRSSSDRYGPGLLTNVNGTLFFAENDGTHGLELWKSDGTAAGTVMVKDIVPGPDSSDVDRLTNVNGELFFSSSVNLWKSDGTAEGTIPVPNPTGTFLDETRDLTELNGSLVFTALSSATFNYGLWITDGTAEGTVLLTEIDRNAAGFLRRENVNGTLYFRNATNELWKTNGTPQSTSFVAAIPTTPGIFRSGIESLSHINDTLIFAANDGVHGDELWKSDGTAAGTMLLKDIAPGGESSYLSGFINCQGTLFFTALDEVSGFSSHGFELWKTDATEAGTVLVKDILPGPASSGAKPLAAAGSTLFFTASTQTDSGGLWISDGTAAGTRPVAAAGTTATAPSHPASIISVNGKTFFSAFDDNSGRELWITDGTPNHTALLADIDPGPGSSYPEDLTNVNGTLYFRAAEPNHGYELWKTDGTASGTTLVKDINPGIGDSYPNFLTNVNGTLFFVANDGAHGFELWKTDGTSDGTVLVKDIAAGPDSSGPSYLVSAGGQLLFSANDHVRGRELWISDGSEAGTILVQDIAAGPSSSYPGQLTFVDGTVLFNADDGLHGRELWTTDGTPSGTVLIKDINPGLDSSYPSEFVSTGAAILFTADDGLHGSELWRTDGTLSGTFLVKNLRPEGSTFSDGSEPQYLTNVGGTLFFSALDGAIGDEIADALWKSDGTSAGTVQVRSFGVGTREYGPHLLTNVNGNLFFAAYDLAHGGELWFSDPATKVTVLAKDFRPGSASSSPANLTAIDGKLFLAADDGLHGSELWVASGAPDSPGVRIRQGVLEITGSPNVDQLSISLSTKKILVTGSLGQTQISQAFALNSVQRIVASLNDGNDSLSISNKIRVPAVVDAGAGNDTILAGAGPTVIVGGDGSDLLFGGKGRDILIGGQGADQLSGDGGTDLLIAGTTAYDQSQDILLVIQQEWTSTRPLALRMANLRAGAGPVLAPLGIRLQPNETVFDDRDVDILFGGADADWFLADPNKDKLRDRTRNETVG